MLQYILFDLDGTLTDSAEGITKSVDHALRTVAGIETADPSTLTPYIGPPLIDGFMENHGLDHDTAVLCKNAYRARYEQVGLFENRVYEGVPAMLDTLRDAGLALAVATSKPEFFSRRILSHFGLDDRFTDIIGATMDGSISTKTEVVREALRRLDNPAPDEVLMVGDRRHDIHGAHENGLRALGVLFGFGSVDELRAAGADYLAATPSETADVILSLR